jgi:hypothetical protein
MLQMLVGLELDVANAALVLAPILKPELGVSLLTS